MADEDIAWESQELLDRYQKARQAMAANQQVMDALRERGARHQVQVNIEAAGLTDLKLEVLLDMLFERDNAQGQENRLDYREAVEAAVAATLAEIDATLDQKLEEIASEQRKAALAGGPLSGVTPEEALQRAAAMSRQIGRNIFVPAAYQAPAPAPRPPG
jgi:hypothetical protein